MAGFTTPVVKEAQWDAGRLVIRYTIPRGVSLVNVAGVWTQARTPLLDGLVDGTDYFLGGHVYQLTPAQVASLTAQGFGPPLITYVTSSTYNTDAYYDVYGGF